MPAWQDYTGQIDQVLGSLDPQTRAVVEAYTTHDAKANPDMANRNYNIAMAELRGKGYSQQDATTLLQVAYNVRRDGGSEINSPFGSGFHIDKNTLDEFFTRGQTPGGNTDDIMGKLDSFYKQLMGPLPDNDPTAQYIQRHAVNAAQRYGGAAGMNGRSTLGAGAASAQYTQGMQAYDMQRKQLAAQVGGLMNQRDLGLGQLQQGYIQYQNQLAEAQAAAQKAQLQGIGSAVGTGIGAIAGSYFGGAQGAQMGIQAGGQFGAGLFGLASGQPNFSMGGGPGRPAGIGGRNPYTGY